MSEAFDRLVKRCEEARLEYGPLPPEVSKAENSGGLCVYLPKGRETSKILVLSDEAAQGLLAASFERWRAMAGYKALWSPELGAIECALEPSGSALSTVNAFEVGHARKLLRSLGYEAEHESLLAPGRRMESASDAGLAVSIGAAGDPYGMLLWFADGILLAAPGLVELDEAERSLILRIQGVRTSAHDDAVELLGRVGDSLLFGLDLSLGLSLPRPGSPCPRWQEFSHRPSKDRKRPPGRSPAASRHEPG